MKVPEPLENVPEPAGESVTMSRSLVLGMDESVMLIAVNGLLGV